jgi:GPH family glycoside/pentoside/hexuronide:cation symporter
VIPRRTRLAYGFAHVGIFSVEFLVRFHLLKFMTDVVRLRADLAGAAVALGVIWDAVTDPPMGDLSDRTRTRWGRRRPYVAAGGVTLALAVALLFSPPALETQAGKFAFFLLSYMLMNTCMTVISVPHYALGGEISADSGERTEAYGWLVFWGQIGSALGVVLPAVALARTGGGAGATRRAYALAAAAVGAAVLVSALVTTLAVREPGELRETPRAGGPGFRRATLSALRNRAFLPLFAMYTTMTVGLSASSVLALYYYEYRLGLTQEQISSMMVAFVAALCLSLPVWAIASRRLGKKWPALAGCFLFGALSSLAYPFLPPGRLGPPLAVGVVGGVCGGSLVLLYSLATDIVDDDEARTGRQREGLYFGLWNMGTKLARAVAVASTGVLLHRIRFVPDRAQDPEVARSLAWIFGPGTGAFLILGALIFLGMPPIERRRDRIRRLVERRRARARNPSPRNLV